MLFTQQGYFLENTNYFSDLKELKKLPSYAYLHECFHYDQVTGKLFWKERPPEHFESARLFKIFNTQFSGKPAGSMRCTKGKLYHSVTISPLKLETHRVVWKMITGRDPVAFIDHINGDSVDNRFSNLREATNAENMRNTKRLRSNTSGFKGVSKFRNGKWVAKIKINGKSFNLGYYCTPEEAFEVYKQRAKEAFGEFFHDGN
jgi:hypothetical protein